jgi:hypothetical protein
MGPLFSNRIHASLVTYQSPDWLKKCFPELEEVDAFELLARVSNDAEIVII